MKPVKGLFVSAAVLGLALSHSTAFAEEDMLQFAAERGCLICHAVEPAPASDDPNAVKPVGPAYQHVAERYHGQEDAFEQLVTIVKTGSNPYERHWKDETSGLAMPPNAVALQEGDAEKLVTWILSLAEEKPAAETGEAKAAE